MNSPGNEIEKRLEAVQAQLHLYARDLQKVMRSEREKSDRLRLANRQLQAFAKDFRTAFVAEQQKARELEKAYHDTVLRLVKAMRYKDDETGAHVIRLSHYGKLVAQSLAWTGEAAQMLFDAAPMHDVGKIGIPDAILQKPGPLNPSEWEMVRRHPVIGASLLQGSPSPLLEMARAIALGHHERWDGSGYPSGARGEEIPPAARIVMICDQYDALRCRRPYKPARSHAEAVAVILEGDGRTLPQHFDPVLLQVFRGLHPKMEEIHGRFAD